MESPPCIEVSPNISREQLLELCGEHMGIFNRHIGYWTDQAQPKDWVDWYASYQMLGFPEDFVQAVNGGPEQYHNFINRAVEQEPGCIYEEPALLGLVDNEMVRQQAITYCLRNKRAYEVIDEFAPYMKPDELKEELDTYADRADGMYLSLPTLGRWLKAGYDDVATLRKIALKGLNDYDLVWQTMSWQTPHSNRLRNSDANKHEAYKAHLDQCWEDIGSLVTAEVLTWAEIEANLIARLRPEFNGYRDDSDYIHQFINEAHEALSMMMVQGLTETSVDKYTELTNALPAEVKAEHLYHLFRTEKIWKYENILPDEFKAIVIDNLVLADNPMLMVQCAKYYEHVGQKEKAVQLANQAFDILRSQKSLDELSDREMYDLFSFWSMPTNISDAERETLRMDFARHFGRLKFEVSNTVIWEAPKGDPELINKLREKLSSDSSAGIVNQDHERYAEYIGVTLDEMKRTILRSCLEEGIGGLYALSRFMEQIIDNKCSLPLTYQDIYSTLLAIIRNNLEQLKNKYYLGDTADVLRQLGAEMTTEFITDIEAEAPEIAMLLSARLYDVADSIERSIQSLLERDDYYAYKTLCFSLGKITHFCADPSAISLIIERALELFDPADLYDVGWYLAPYMTTHQIAAMDQRIARNPAEYTNWLDLRKSIPYFANKTPELLISNETVNSLAVFAPKMHQHMMRRLNNRASHKNDGNRILAQYSYAEELAGWLAENALELAQQATAALPAKKEKDELQRLEVMYIAGRHARLNELAVTDTNVKSVLGTPFRQLGFDTQQVERLFTHFEAEAMQLPSVAMWVDQSLKSRVLTNYMKQFLDEYTQTGSLRDWKRSNPHPSLTALDAESRETWFAGYSSHTTINAEPVELKVSHDLKSVYLAGSQPTLNCLHYGYGLNRHGLVDLLNSHVAVAEIRNAKDRVQANAIVRLVQEKDQTALLVEPVYDSYTDYFVKSESYLALTRMLFDFSEQLGVGLVLGGSDRITSTFRNLMAGVVELPHGKWGLENKTIDIIPGTGPFNYSDVSGIHRHKRQTKAVPMGRVILAGAS